MTAFIAPQRPPVAPPPTYRPPRIRETVNALQHMVAEMEAFGRCPRCADIDDLDLCRLRQHTYEWDPDLFAAFTPTEAALAELLGQYPGRWISAVNLSKGMGGLPVPAVRTVVYRLRQKLPPGLTIENRLAVGYRLVVPG